MRVFIMILVCAILFNSEYLMGQCPERDTLWNRIISIRSSKTKNYADKLKSLLIYDQQIKACPQHIDSVYTYLLLSIGVLCYRTADYNQAVFYTNQALQIIQANASSPSISTKVLAQYYFYLSIYYDSLKMSSKKNEAIDSSISKEIKENSDYGFTLVVLENNVRDLYEKGEYNLCIDRATLGEALIHKFFRGSDSANRIIFYIYYKAFALRSLKKFHEEELFLQSKKSEFLKSRNEYSLGIIFRLFGNLSEVRGEYENAIQDYRKAHNYDLRTSGRQLSAAVLSDIGKIYTERFNQDQIALEYYRKALLYANYKTLANGTVSDSFYILGNIANVYVRLKSFDSAFYFFQKAFDVIKTGINENDLISDIQNYVDANSVETVINLVLDKANARLQLYFFKKDPAILDQALAIYKTADILLTKIKADQSEIQSKLFWQHDLHSLYEHAVEVAFLQNNSRDAFYFFEKSRAVLLNEQLRQQNRNSDVDLLEQAKLKRQILVLKRLREESTIGSNQYIDVQRDLIVNEQSLERLERKMKNNELLYYKDSGDIAFFTIKDLQKYLANGKQELLEIFSGDSAIYSLFITREKVYFGKINKTKFDSTAGSFMSYISNPDLLNSQFENYVKTAESLYQIIFRNYIVNDGRIIISPDGKIFPFEALVTRSDTKDVEYFISGHAVSYTYSARYLLAEFESNKSENSGTFLGIAPIQYYSGFSLAELQGSDRSLDQIGLNFNDPHNLIYADASKINFQRQFSDYAIIQLYTHASDSSNRGEPVIYFADSTLYLSDLIPEKKPQTRLIVLSGCETGIGKLYQGEGVFSFNRGFASLGIPSSIINLWAVDNQATYRLTELFYKYLSSGFPIDVSLQKAKLEFIKTATKQNRLPYYWAPAVLAGRSDAIMNKKKFPWKDLILVSSVTALSFFIWQKRKSHKNNSSKSLTPTPDKAEKHSYGH